MVDDTPSSSVFSCGNVTGMDTDWNGKETEIETENLTEPTRAWNIICTSHHNSEHEHNTPEHISGLANGLRGDSF